MYKSSHQYISLYSITVREVFAHELWGYNREGEAVATGMEIVALQ